MIDIAATALARFLDRLLLRSQLSEAEQRAILALSTAPVSAEPNQTIIHPGARVNRALLVGQGVVARFDLMRNGARQITALHLPGDMGDLHSVVAPVTGWGIVALGQATLLRVPHEELRALATRYPNLALAFWRDTTVDSSILAKAVANIGRKEARPRIAHLLCELGVRMELAGRGRRESYPLPLTQENIGDAVGLTPVHVNRVLKGLRDEGLVSIAARQVEIGDWDRLVALAEFSPTYLLIPEKQRAAA